MLGFSLPLLALEMSGEGSDLALIKGAGFVPNVLFAIFIGVINDRMLKAQAFRRYGLGIALVTLLLCGAMVFDKISIVGLALFIVVFNGLQYAIGNAQMGLLRLTVAQDRLSDATALTSTVFSVIATAGPAVAGFMLLSLGHVGLVTFCAAVMMLSAALSFFLSPAEMLPKPTPFWPSLAEGVRVLSQNRELVMMTVVIVLTNAAAGAFETALILKMKTGLALDEFTIGLVVAAAGVGAVVFSRIAAPARRWLGYRAAFFWPILMLAGVYLMLIEDWPIWALAAISFLEGGLSLFFAIGVWSYRQESTEAQHIGRVAGLTGAIFKLGMPPVIILAGVMTDAGHVSQVFVMAAGINISAALFLVYVAGWGWPVRV